MRALACGLALFLVACGPLWQEGKPGLAGRRFIITREDTGDRLVVEGRLQSAQTECTADQEVIVKASSGKQRLRTVGSTNTSVTGEFEFQLNERVTAFELTSPASEFCGEAKYQ